MEMTEPDIADFIRGRIKRALELSPLSAAEVARRMGVTSACVSNWKTGRREVPSVKLVRLADVLGLPASELLPAGPLGRSATPPSG